MTKIKQILKSITVGTTVGALTGGAAGISGVDRSREAEPSAVPNKRNVRNVLTQNISPDYLNKETTMTHVLRGGVVGMFIAFNIAIFPLWGITSFTICGCYAIEKSIAEGYLPPASTPTKRAASTSSRHTLHTGTKSKTSP